MVFATSSILVLILLEACASNRFDSSEYALTMYLELNAVFAASTALLKSNRYSSGIFFAIS